MHDFVSNFWPWYIFVLVVASFVGMFWLLIWLRGATVAPGEKAETMGHVWDENLEELNNPLPTWWANLFYITLFFGIGYLALYPALGLWKGALGWTQTGQWEKEMKDAENRYGPLYEKYRSTELSALVADKDAARIGQRLFATYCTNCHGSDGGGGPGFPNLRDKDWLYGGKPEDIVASIANGRRGTMPGWAAALGEPGVQQVSEYVLSLSGRKVDQNAALAGKEKFQQICAACHGAEGKGNPALGAPNLTDSVWLYGGTQTAVMKTIREGRQGVMPAHGELLGEAKVRLLAAYVYSLSQEQQTK